MPISVTCECGARLEIDEKFLGKDVPCPDCNRLLPTKAPPKPPPLELPDHRRTSGLAILSLALGLVGSCTLVGSLAAIGTGIWAVRVISRSKKLDGLNLARAGIIVGGIGIFATLMMLVTPLGLDGVFRVLAFLGRTNEVTGPLIETRNGEMVIKRPGAGQWAIGNQSQNLQAEDDLIMVDRGADTYMACQHYTPELNDDEEVAQRKVLEHVRKSELVNVLGRLNGRPALELTVFAQKKAEKADGVNEVIADLRFGGMLSVDRRFLILYKTTKAPPRVHIFVGCARTGRFERVQEQFREAFAGFAPK